MDNNKLSFVEAISYQLKTKASNAENITEEEWAMFRCISADLYEKGYNQQDAIQYLLLSEEMNPQIPEERALSEKYKIKKKYEKEQ